MDLIYNPQILIQRRIDNSLEIFVERGEVSFELHLNQGTSVTNLAENLKVLSDQQDSFNLSSKVSDRSKWYCMELTNTFANHANLGPNRFLILIDYNLKNGS